MNQPDSDSKPDDLADKLAANRDRLTRMIRFRLDRRIRGRIDPSDIVQEAYLEAFRRYDDYRRENKMPFYVWLRFLTVQQLQIAQRRHLGFQMRSAHKDVSLHGTRFSDSATALADALSDSLTSPSAALQAKEMKEKLIAALELLSENDREILALRHFEQLTTKESAQILGISEGLASTRYGRALRRLLKLISDQSNSSAAREIPV
jgi:RNA polymerase sigma-70 factor (ECF subfamily)